MKNLIFVLGLIIGGVSAIAQQGGMAKADLASEEKAIREISKSWLEMEKNDNVDGIVELFSEDAVLYRPNMEPVKGRNAIKKQFTISQEQNPKEIMNWNTERVDVASSGDLAVEYGNFDVKNSGPEGNESDHGTYVTVFRKDQGKWKITADFVNSTKPIKE